MENLKTILIEGSKEDTNFKKDCIYFKELDVFWYNYCKKDKDVIGHNDCVDCKCYINKKNLKLK